MIKNLRYGQSNSDNFSRQIQDIVENLKEKKLGKAAKWVR